MTKLPKEYARYITCPICNKISYNPHDIEQGYCGYCHAWTSDKLFDMSQIDMELFTPVTEA